MKKFTTDLSVVLPNRMGADRLSYPFCMPIKKAVGVHKKSPQVISEGIFRFIGLLVGQLKFDRDREANFYFSSSL